MNRREFLGALGTAGAAGAAGCATTSPSAATKTRAVTETQLRSSRTPAPTPTPTVTDSPTPTTSPTPTPEPAAFNVEWDVPERVEINEEFELRVTIENVGGRVGRFSAPMYYRQGDGQWTRTAVWRTGGLSPGEETELVSSSVLTFPTMQKLTFRLGDYPTTASVQIVSAQRAYGSPFTVFNDTTLIISGLEFDGAFTYTRSGRDYRADSDADTQYCRANVWAKNPTGEIKVLPSPRNIHLISGDSQYDVQYFSAQGEYQGGEVNPGIVREGWLAYLVPDDLSESDIEIVWSRNFSTGDVAVHWSSDS